MTFLEWGPSLLTFIIDEIRQDSYKHYTNNLTEKLCFFTPKIYFWLIRFFLNLSVKGRVGPRGGLGSELSTLKKGKSNMVNKKTCKSRQGGCRYEYDGPKDAVMKKVGYRD